MLELVATILRPGYLAPNIHVTVENVILIGALFDNVARVDLDFENVMTAWHVGDVNPLVYMLVNLAHCSGYFALQVYRLGLKYVYQWTAFV